MPTAIVAAGLSVGGSIIGGAMSSSASKSAAKTQASAADRQAAAMRENRDYITGLSQPTINRGNAAGSLIGQFLGAEGGDAAKSALGTCRGSTGYQDLLSTGLGAVNSNAYAKGLGASGLTLKALQAKGQALADRSSGQWLSGLNSLSSAGNTAIATIANTNTQTTNGINQTTQNAADASSLGTLASAGAWSNALQQLAELGGNYAKDKSAGMASSYTPPGYGGPIGQTMPSGYINFGETVPGGYGAGHRGAPPFSMKDYLDPLSMGGR